MLTQVSTTASSAVTPAKQIFITSSGKAAYSTIYTVPPGKTFTGHILVSTNSGWVFTINGVESNQQGGTTAYYATPIPVTLIEGTTVGTGGTVYNWQLMGIEE